MAWPSRGELLPRKAPDSVQEMRHTFGTLERQELMQAKTELFALERRRQNLAAMEKLALPLAIAGTGMVGVFVISNTWQKINDLIPSFDGVLDGLSNVIHGDQETKEAILRDAQEQAAQDGKPLTFWQKARNRFAFDAFRFGGGVF